MVRRNRCGQRTWRLRIGREPNITDSATKANTTAARRATTRYSEGACCPKRAPGWSTERCPMAKLARMQRRKGIPKGKKNRGRMNLSVLAPSFNRAAKFLCFPAQSVARIFLLHFLGKRSRSLFLWKPVHPCANPRQRGPLVGRTRAASTWHPFSVPPGRIS